MVFTDRIEVDMIVEFNFNNITESLPDVGRKVLCKTSNGNYFISEMYLPHDGRGNVYEGRPAEWKGSSKATDTIIMWAYLPD